MPHNRKVDELARFVDAIKRDLQVIDVGGGVGGDVQMAFFCYPLSGFP
jgi:hypothetical protein